MNRLLIVNKLAIICPRVSASKNLVSANDCSMSAISATKMIEVNQKNNKREKSEQQTKTQTETKTQLFRLSSPDKTTTTCCCFDCWLESRVLQS